MSKRNLDEDMEAEVEGLEDSEEEKEMGKTDFVFLTFFFVSASSYPCYRTNKFLFKGSVREK